jgi:hypothetical protein
MALTLDQLKQLAEQADLRYFIEPHGKGLLIGIRGIHGSYQIMLVLEVDGKFLQFRTIDNPYCPIGHPHLLEVLKVIGAINYRMRLIKLGWDPNDGEIIAYADLWVMDGTVSPGQFEHMTQNFFSALDDSFRRLKQALETGKDPGEEDQAATLKRALDQLGGSLPPPLRELLEKLQGEGSPGDADEGPELKEI